MHGINTRKLKTGTVLKVQTQNHIYTIKLLDEKGMVLVFGGKKIPEPKECFFNGSTFGGTMLKIGWVGPGMFMEFCVGRKRVVTTTSVKNAIIQGDNWEYNLNWSTEL